MLADIAVAGWSESRSDSGEVRFDMWVPSANRDAAGTVRRALGHAGVDCAVDATPQAPDWQDGLRRHHHPIDVDGRLRVRPPWVAAEPGHDVVIDPGMAFGTGQHATTRGCLRLLLDVPAGSVIDVGTGSGVLAIAAAKLGHAPVRAIDNDPLAVEATLRNAAANAVALDAVVQDAAALTLTGVDTVIANITRIHVAALAAALGRPEPRHAVLSGFLVDDVDAATGPWIAVGYRTVATVAEDGWAAVRLDRPPE